MPGRADWRIEAVAKRANVSERTARRWRDSGDPRWDNLTAPFQNSFEKTLQDFGINPPPLVTPQPANGFELLMASKDNGEAIDPESMTMRQLGEAVEELRVLLTRLTDLLCREPAIIEWPSGKIVEVAYLPWDAIGKLDKLQKKLDLEKHRLAT